MATDTTADNLSAQIAQQLRADGCGISLLGWPVEASDPIAAALEDWQFVLGTGPSPATLESGRATEHVGSIDDLQFTIFEAHLDAAKIRSAASFPIVVDAETVGAMTVYRTSTDSLSDGQRIRAERSAHAVAQSIQHDPAGWANRRHLVTANFHQAIGYVIAELGLAPDDAAIMIRAHAFASSTPLRAVCDDILAGANPQLV